MKVPIRFTENWRGYNAGEVAGFEPDRAASIVNSNVGVPLTRKDLKDREDAEKEEDKRRLEEGRQARIRASVSLYQGMIERLCPKKDKARIAALREESDKMATLIAESRS
jgi:hypothetical protein